MQCRASLRWLGHAHHPPVYAASPLVTQATFERSVAGPPRVTTARFVPLGHGQHPGHSAPRVHGGRFGDVAYRHHCAGDCDSRDRAAPAGLGTPLTGRDAACATSLPPESTEPSTDRGWRLLGVPAMPRCLPGTVGRRGVLDGSRARRGRRPPPSAEHARTRTGRRLRTWMDRRSVRDRPPPSCTRRRGPSATATPACGRRWSGGARWSSG